MAYAQWVVMTVGATGTTLSIKNAQVAWGKFFQYNDKDREVSSDDINKISDYLRKCGRYSVVRERGCLVWYGRVF